MPINFSSLSGGTSFTILASSGGTKTATLDRSYPAGTYLIESKANDTNLEVYLGATDGSQVGYATAGAKSITASSSFLYVTTINADANDAIIFTLKTASTLATKTDAVWAPPTITDITPSGLPNVNNTTTITGTNFASNVDVKFRKSDDSTLVNAKTVVRGSATSIIAGRPDTFSPTDAPYDVIVTNPSTGLVATSLNSITAGAVPVWVTSTTLNSATLNQAFSQTIQATDSDGGSSITYAILSGALQTGLSLDSSTGVISGTPTGSSGTTTVTISATDSGGNAVNRTFTHVINANSFTLDYLVVAGGGAGSCAAWNNAAAGGGAGGYRTSIGGTSLTILPSTNYTVQVGAGGSGTTHPAGVASSPNVGNGGDGGSGTNSIFSTITSTGGGGGAHEGAGVGSGRGFSGGSGGGSVNNPNGGLGNTPATSPSQGNNGGTSSGDSGSGGGGATTAGTNGTSATSQSNTGGSGSNSASSWASITSSGDSGYFAGGGAGAGYEAGAGANGGIGGGGFSKSRQGNAGSGATNTGGGGGGAAGDSGGARSSGNGGSGIVILKYPNTFTITLGAGLTGTTYTSGSDKYTKITQGTGTVSWS